MSEKKQGDKQSNGRHALREAYTAKREKQLLLVRAREHCRLLRTPYEQMAILDERLGIGVGAKKERARLMLESLDPSIDEYDDFAQARMKFEVAKMESLGYRIMRRQGLAPRTPIDYDSERVAREWIACVRARVGYRP